MDKLIARARIETMTSWETAPALTAIEVEDLLIVAARMDRYGVEPATTGWEATYDLNAAAAEGWRWKAAKVTGAFDFVSDGQRFDRSQQHAMCLQMSDHYRRRLLGNVRVRSNRPIIATEEPFLP